MPTGFAPSHSPIRLFATDLDGTLLGNPESAQRFKDAWESVPRNKRRCLVYNSGRSVKDTLSLIAARKLSQADYIIGGVGTEFHDATTPGIVPEFVAQFGEGWNLPLVEEIVGTTPGVERQPPEFLHPYKSSWYLHRATREQIEALKHRLNEVGLHVTVVYSSLRYLDVLPSRADKGNALAWLCQRIGVPLDAVLVAGDTGNDSSMFLLDGVKGIAVENAQPELLEAVVKLPVFVATRVMADGVLEGLKHFGVIPDIPSLHGPAVAARTPATWQGMLFGPDSLQSLSRGDRDLIAEGYDRALIALRKNITPIGFSACSLSDNEATGTDENYFSVWARDGCFTVVQTVEMNDPDIRAAQRSTLCTLLDAMAPNGQVPANVRIKDLSPEYAGIGGICSIDSGLWLVIAVYHYVTHANDTALLDEYAPRLQRIMDWLSAHDSNNDGLIEVPEAGDWTDLFGRSYHVLYDEVLWYRANVCFGRMLEYRRDFDRAADYLRWSQQIAGKIKASFWPSTRDDRTTGTFADRQASLGDTQYLLAEITPFAFNWRCDVLGNVLAFLTNVVDVDRARTAFRFMWGVGVNQPWPVANLYPAVQSGDPDWRPYYTVNLLNLPHHYHNGGAWPFIGGMWVRFIHRLGLQDIARNELVKLAQVNRLGKTQTWEFNEWVHGGTGLPMGKAYQAWSAAAYLRACQELHLGPEAVHDE
jgi:sucrose-6-phosphatase